MTALVFFLAGSGRAWAQQTAPAGRAYWGYFFVAPGFGGVPNQQQVFHWGGGAEWAFHERLGIAGEIGALHTAAAAAYPLLMLSLNGAYYAREKRARAFVPFITAGYTGSSNISGLDMPWFNAGAGVHYWFRPNKGVRLEVRYHITGRGNGCYELLCSNWTLESRVALNF